MLQFLGISAAVIGFLASIPYIKEIIKGRTKPQRMAWVIFITLSGISFFAQWAEGATDSLWFPLVLFTQAIIIFCLTLKYGMGGFSKFDIVSFILAVLIMVVWAITKSPAIAIICTNVVNVIGKILVAQKVYKHPDTEYLPTWIWSVVASVLAALSVGKLDWILLLPSVQNAITVGAIAALIAYRRSKLKSLGIL